MSPCTARSRGSSSHLVAGNARQVHRNDKCAFATPPPRGVRGASYHTNYTALSAGEAAGLRHRLWHSLFAQLRGTALKWPPPEDWASATRPGHLVCGMPVGAVAYVRAHLHERAFGACPVSDARQMALDARADTAPSDCIILGIVAGLDNFLYSPVRGLPTTSASSRRASSHALAISPLLSLLRWERPRLPLSHSCPPHLGDVSAVLRLPTRAGGHGP
jgi:hypothetical protein